MCLATGVIVIGNDTLVIVIVSVLRVIVIVASVVHVVVIIIVVIIVVIIIIVVVIVIDIVDHLNRYSKKGFDEGQERKDGKRSMTTSCNKQ